MLRDDLRKKVEDAGCCPPKSAKRNELVELLLIKDCRSIGYDECTIEELQNFAEDRGLVASNGTKKKEWLLENLLQADKERTFYRIMDLSPELRLRIYGFYLDGIKRQSLQTPSQPPLVRVIQLIRKEFIAILQRIPITSLHSTLRYDFIDKALC